MRARQHATCPMDALLRLLMGPWTTYLIWVLREKGPLRFGELKRELNGVSSRVLTQRLRMLEEAGLVARDYRPTVPPAVSYSLTERADELGEVLEMLARIADRWDIKGDASVATLVSENVE